MKALEKKLVHVVNFYLKPGLSEDDRRRFEAGVSSLHTIDDIAIFNVGKPAPVVDSPTIDKDYDYCMLCVFENLEAHDRYQAHPVHINFIEQCKQYWSRVVVFDSETI
ncbi:Dabb family protein [Chitinophaga oryzae]|uniref:Dabb family protein n=1 Tax=Chitinophaga oryzae TaxID=2725414 RepID=A0AAE6ZKN8_9BACT|nr:Dabb family protein [Chitinophaga oryzae]QJB34362.1 Dabb family protein [Chitinophaga oryzae]QJB40881.1 Dabb family protein [Chitinophaga oryzae]